MVQYSSNKKPYHRILTTHSSFDKDCILLPFFSTTNLEKTRYAASLFKKYLNTITPSTTSISSQELKQNMFSDDAIEEKYTIIDVR